MLKFGPKIRPIFWDLLELRRRGVFDGIDVKKMSSLQNRFDLGEEEKVTWGKIGGILQCSFLQETDKYSGLCKQERYRDGAPMRCLPKGSASCDALILRDAEESFYRRFGSLFGLGVGIRNERCLEYL